MDNSNKFKIARQALGKNQKEMADLVKVAHRSWQGYEQGTSVPGGNVLKVLAELGFNVNWFFDDGETPMFTEPRDKAAHIDMVSEIAFNDKEATARRTKKMEAVSSLLHKAGEAVESFRDEIKEAPVDTQIEALTEKLKRETLNRLLAEDRLNKEEEWIMVPQYGDRLSDGGGSFVENGNEVVGHFAFKPKWLKRKCLSGKCAVFHVAGDSMFPIIQDGDVVLVDMGQNDPKEVRDGKIYAFSEGELIRVKRLSWEGQALWSISDNKQVSPDRAIDMSIFSLIGRVIWVGHEVW
ncbi:MAG: S24 family peptidase [Desulfobulbaceae bacterium]|nr:S24 family peptidase [Desulfobulbaceae bacterium]